METQLVHNDLQHFQRAIELAQEAEEGGNLPIGCVVSFDGRIVAEGKNAIWVPEFNPIRHAEMEALVNVPRELWENSRHIKLYSTLEPCLMCTAAVLQHRVGKVLYGASDGYGGSGNVFGKMPLYFEQELASVQWLGPVFPEACDPLFQRAMELIENRSSS